jgi:hypothetical protein
LLKHSVVKIYIFFVKTISFTLSTVVLRDGKGDGDGKGYGNVERGRQR